MDSSVFLCHGGLGARGVPWCRYGQKHHFCALFFTINVVLRPGKIDVSQPLGKYLSFLEASIAFEGMGRLRGFRGFRKTHLENILPRGSQGTKISFWKICSFFSNKWIHNYCLIGWELSIFHKSRVTLVHKYIFTRTYGHRFTDINEPLFLSHT